MNGERRRTSPTSARGVSWHLAVKQSAGGPEYAVYVDGALVTDGHATGELAVAEAVRLLAPPPAPGRASAKQPDEGSRTVSPGALDAAGD
jgi:hypothetical protein